MNEVGIVAGEEGDPITATDAGRGQRQPPTRDVRPKSLVGDGAIGCDQRHRRAIVPLEIVREVLLDGDGLGTVGRAGRISLCLVHTVQPD